MPTKEISKLNRFTKLPFLLDLIVRKQLTLLNPEIWEDYNDRKTVKLYQQLKKAAAIYALCLTHKSETVHHWMAFSAGPSGCCIQFDYKKLTALLKQKSIYHRETVYAKLADLNKYSKKNSHIIPFVKRIPFSNENEYRIIALSTEPQQPSFDIPITLDVITKITLSNKLSKNTFESIKATICCVEPSLKNRIVRSTLFENTRWINYFSELATGS